MGGPEIEKDSKFPSTPCNGSGHHTVLLNTQKKVNMTVSSISLSMSNQIMLDCTDAPDHGHQLQFLRNDLAHDHSNPSFVFVLWHGQKHTCSAVARFACHDKGCSQHYIHGVLLHKYRFGRIRMIIHLYSSVPHYTAHVTYYMWNSVKRLGKSHNQ